MNENVRDGILITMQNPVAKRCVTMYQRGKTRLQAMYYTTDNLTSANIWKNGQQIMSVHDYASITDLAYSIWLELLRNEYDLGKWSLTTK